MHPILFEIPGLHWPVRAFGLMVMLGFLVGAHFLTGWGTKGSARPAEAKVGFSALPLWVLFGVVAGARALYV
ncbi:MAG: prolipoprotein diacylglyceryl transferase, partial [Planctomycetota bacterium]